MEAIDRSLAAAATGNGPRTTDHNRLPPCLRGKPDAVFGFLWRWLEQE